jgi:hypothetical protein
MQFENGSLDCLIFEKSFTVEYFGDAGIGK